MVDILDFEYMYKDTPCAHIVANFISHEVQYTPLTDVYWKLPWDPKWQAEEDVLRFFAGRVFDENRPDLADLLRLAHVDCYDPLQICLFTHARVATDDFWIKFKGETLTWRDVHGVRPI